MDENQLILVFRPLSPLVLEGSLGVVTLVLGAFAVMPLRCTQATSHLCRPHLDLDHVGGAVEHASVHLAVGHLVCAHIRRPMSRAVELPASALLVEYGLIGLRHPSPPSPRPRRPPRRARAMCATWRRPRPPRDRPRGSCRRRMCAHRPRVLRR